MMLKIGFGTTPGKRLGLPIALIVLIVFLVYAPVYSYSYFLNDDYKLAAAPLTGFHCHSLNYWSWNLSLGRPLANYAQCASMGMVAMTGNFQIARVISVAVIATIACLFFLYFIACGMGINWAFLIGASGAILPGMLYSATLIAAVQILWGLFFGIIAATCFVISARAAHRPLAKAGLHGLAFACSCISIFLYQISFMIIVALLVLPAISNTWRKDERLRLVITAGIYLTVAVAAFLAWYKLSGRYDRIANTPYGQHPIDYMTRAWWYINEVIPRAMGLWFINTPRWLAWILYTILIALMLYPRLTHEESRQKIGFVYADWGMRLLAISMAPVLCYAPVIISANDQVLFRTMIPLSILILLITYSMIERYWAQILAKINGLKLSMMALALSPLALYASWLITVIDVYPHASELNYMVRTAQAAATTGNCTEHVHFIQPRTLYTPTNDRLRTDEFYRIATSFGDEFYPSIARVVYNLAGGEAPITVSSSKPDEPITNVDECTLILDMNAFSRTLTW